ncbi:MAG: fibronectin type III domain-containing protein [Bacteroidales bacterium]|nr:fibronectin type III domain-containing protein [Bacteroidales bacterium]
MKKLLLSFVMAILLLSGVKAQDTISIANGTTYNNSMAIGGYYGFHTGAYLYTSDEMLNQGCTINSLLFQMQTAGSGSNRTLKIYLKEVVDESLPHSLVFANLLEGAMLVYDQSITTLTSNAWNEFVFDSPFVYTGIGNLLVIYESTGCSPSGGCQTYMYFDNSISGKGWARTSDDTPMDYNIPQSKNNAYRANVKFVYTAMPEDFCMPVSDLVVSNIQMSSADVSWDGTADEYAYELKLASEAWTSENVERGAVNSSFITFTGLNPTTNYNVRIKAVCSEDNESTWMTTSFKTTCLDLITELPYIEHFQNGLDCWQIMRESYSSYGDHVGPMMEGDVAKFGENMSMMAISAPFQEPINNLRVYFEMRSLAYYGVDHLTIGYVTDLTDTTTFVPIQTFSADVNSGWQSRMVSFENVEVNDELTYYIAVKVQGSSSTYFYIRRFEVEMLPECPAPQRTSVTVAPSAETAQISWVDTDPTHGAWNVYYRELPADEEPTDDWTIQNADAMTTVLENLTPQTTYQAFVVTDCGTGDISDKTDTVVFTTTATAVELPYIQDFEDMDNLSGILLTQIAGNNTWHIGSAVAYMTEGEESGSSLYISGDNGVSNTYTNSTSVALASIIVDFSEQAEYIMEFDLKVKGEYSYTPYDYFRVYALDASQPLSNYASGTALCSQKANILNWEHQTITFPAEFIGTTKNIILLWYNDNSTQNNPPAAVDNIHIRATNCVPAENVALVSTEQNSATLSWEGTAESYIVTYYKASEPTEVMTEDVYDATIELTDLEGSTEYVVTITSVCGDETSRPTDALHFITDCAPITDDVWFENFDAAYGSESAANQMFMCYDVLVSTQANNGTFPRIYHQGYAPAAHSGAVTLEFKGPGLLALPEFDRPLNTLRFEFYANTTASSAATAGVMEVGLITDEMDSTSFVPLQTVEPVGFSRSGSFLVGPFDFDQLSYTEGRIALRYTPEPANYGESWNLDDFKVIPIPACPSPNANSVVVSNVTDVSATISWTDTDETHNAWIVYYKSADEEDYTSVSATEQSITLTELEAITSYSVYVQTDCGTEDNVSRTDIVTFSTIATPITDFPYYQTFEDLESNPASFEFRNEYVNEWYVGTATGVPSDEEETTTSLYISNDQGVSNAYSVSDGSYASAIMPVTFGESSEYILSFDYKLIGEIINSNKYDYFMLFMCDGGVNIPSNGQPQGEGVTVLMDKTTDVPAWTNASISLSNVSNTTKQIVFYWRNDSYGGTNPPIAIDNISIVGVDCASPTNLASTTITANEATLSWQENGSATSWTIYYKSENETEYSSVVVSENPATITNLSPATTYTAYVVADCDGEYSGSSNTLSFITECATIDEFPYYQGFETNPVACWNAQLISGSENWEVRNSLGYAAAYEGLKIMAVNFTSGNARLTTPIFDITSLENPSVKFAYYNSAYGGVCEEIRLQYKANADAEWTDITVIDTPHGEWTLDSIALPNPSETYQLSFLVLGHFGNGAAIDAFQIYDCEGCEEGGELPQPCEAPTALTVSNITETSAEVSWEGDAEVYEVRFNALVTESIIGNDVQYTGLIPNTLYMVEVRAVCGVQTSEWVSTTFATLEEIVTPEPCDAPTALSASNITETSAEITWNGTATTYEFKLNGGEAETLTTTTKTLTGLTANTAYTVEVRAICEDQTSDWVSTTFTTLEEIIPEPEVVEGQVSTLSATNVGNTSATLNGALVSAGNSENFTVGFALATVADFTLETAEVQNITSTLTDATFSQSVTDLVEGQTYFYRAYITNEAGTAYGAVETFTLLGLNDAIAGMLQATIYPNPATDNATLEINGLNQEAKVVVSDLQGRILSQDNIKAGTTRYTLNVSNMASGVYYIRIVTDKAVSTQKLIVE